MDNITGEVLSVPSNLFIPPGPCDIRVTCVILHSLEKQLIYLVWLNKSRCCSVLLISKYYSHDFVNNMSELDVLGIITCIICCRDWKGHGSSHVSLSFSTKLYTRWCIYWLVKKYSEIFYALNLFGSYNTWFPSIGISYKVFVLQISVDTVDDPKVGIIFDPRSLIQALDGLVKKRERSVMVEWVICLLCSAFWSGRL